MEHELNRSKFSSGTRSRSFAEDKVSGPGSSWMT